MITYITNSFRQIVRIGEDLYLTNHVKQQQKLRTTKLNLKSKINFR